MIEIRKIHHIFPRSIRIEIVDVEEYDIDKDVVVNTYSLLIDKTYPSAHRETVLTDDERECEMRENIRLFGYPKTRKECLWL